MVRGSKAQDIKAFNESMKYPFDCSFEISGKGIDVLYEAREEITSKCGKFGRRIGSGCGFGACDTQIAFRTEFDAKKAKGIAKNIAKKFGAKLHFSMHKYPRKEFLEMYGLTEADVKKMKTGR